MKKAILLFTGLAFLIFKNQAQTVTDIDGNVYNTVTIGTQVWMLENLKVTRYCNGDTIPNVTDTTQWSNLTYGAYCNYNNDSNNGTVYGRLYNWFVTNDSRKIAPLGWHVSTDYEWSTMQAFLGGYHEAGSKLKEDDTVHWYSPNVATNESGFTGLPGGERLELGEFTNLGYLGNYWTSTGYSTKFAWRWTLENDIPCLFRQYDFRINGYSIRCVRDSAAQINDFNYYNKLQIYPNPSIDRVCIDCAEIQDVKMQVYNIVGECVLQRELSSGTNDIDVSSLSKGVYIIKITGASKIFQQKLIKE